MVVSSKMLQHSQMHKTLSLSIWHIKFQNDVSRSFDFCAIITIAEKKRKGDRKGLGVGWGIDL